MSVSSDPARSLVRIEKKKKEDPQQPRLQSDADPLIQYGAKRSTVMYKYEYRSGLEIKKVILKNILLEAMKKGNYRINRLLNFFKAIFTFSYFLYL